MWIRIEGEVRTRCLAEGNGLALGCWDAHEGSRVGLKEEASEISSESKKGKYRTVNMAMRDDWMLVLAKAGEEKHCITCSTSMEPVGDCASSEYSSRLYCSG